MVGRHQRRRLLQGLASGVAAAAIGVPARFSLAQTVTGQALASDLHLLTAAGINLIAQTGNDGLLLVDGGPAATADSVFDAATGLVAGAPVHTLFNTHWHPEQTGLNERLGSDGATIIAQENTRLWLATDITYPWDGQHFEPLAEVGQPNDTFFDDGALASGVRYGYLRHAAHTDGDLYVQFPDADVLAVGDAVSAAGWPLVDWWTGGWIGGIVGGLELLLALAGPETRVVPSRGRVLRLTDLEAQYEMYNTIYERLVQLLNSGRGPTEAVAERPTAEFDGAMGGGDEFVRRAFESLWAYLTPDA
jgi:glyoxylase-like metal-dependent hydrolase (beta-lactamase superfamily II)